MDRPPPTAGAGSRGVAGRIRHRLLRPMDVYWAADPALRLPLVQDEGVPLPERVDVAVIGAGITGLAAARALAGRGAAVAVFDRHAVGWGSSGRNGGMVSVGSKRSLASWLEAYGPEVGHRLWDASVQAVHFVEAMIEREGIDCGYARTGLFQAAWRPEHFGLLAQKQRLLAEEVGHETILVPPVDQDQEVGTRRFFGGLVDPLAGALQPRLYVRGLGRAALAAGAKLFENTAVTALEPHGEGHRLSSARGPVHAAEVLVATNAYTGPLTPELRRRIIPIQSQIIATEPLDPALARSLIPRGRIVFDTKRMLYYYRVTADHRMVFGGRATFTPVSAARSGRILRDHLFALYPQLQGVRVDYAWSGVVGFTFDLDPHVGRMEGLHYSMGYCGHGVALGSYLGHLMGELIAGATVDLPFLGLPFPTNPLYRGFPWFLPLADLGYRLLDRVR